MEIKNREKPTQINIAVKLLWTIFIIGFIKFIMEVEYLSFQTSPWFNSAICIFDITISVLCIIFISKGENWARIVYLILFISLLYLSLFTLDEFIRFSVFNTLNVIQIIIEAIVLYLIFTKPGSEWFKKQKSQS